MIYLNIILNVKRISSEFRLGRMRQKGGRVLHSLPRSKKRFKWRFKINGKSYAMELVNSALSGKRLVTLNDMEIYNEKEYLSSHSAFSTSTSISRISSKAIVSEYLELPITSTNSKWGSITKIFRISLGRTNLGSRRKKRVLTTRAITTLLANLQISLVRAIRRPKTMILAILI